MNIYTIRELILLTNSLVHKYLTIEESFNVEKLNGVLLTNESTYVKHIEKILTEYGAVKSDKDWDLRGVKDNKELSDKMLASNLQVIELGMDTKVLSEESLDKQKRMVELNTSQINFIKKWLVIYPIPEKSTN